MLRNALLFQWATLPLQKGAIERKWSTIKLILGGLARSNGMWYATYLKAARIWLASKRAYASAKVTQIELEDILRRIEAPLSSTGSVRLNSLTGVGQGGAQADSFFSDRPNI